jgi:hypothetical protein
MAYVVTTSAELVEVVLTSDVLTFEKRISFFPDGRVRVSFRWDATGRDRRALFTTELSLTRGVELTSEPVAQRWAYPIETVAKSEKGFDRTLQGTGVLLRWAASAGAATVDVAIPLLRRWD